MSIQLHEEYFVGPSTLDHHTFTPVIKLWFSGTGEGSSSTSSSSGGGGGVVAAEAVVVAAVVVAAAAAVVVVFIITVKSSQYTLIIPHSAIQLTSKGSLM